MFRVVLGCALLAVLGVSTTIVGPPLAVTGQRGSGAIRCITDSPGEYTVQIKKHIPVESPETIFDSVGGVSDPEKYEIDQNTYYNLIVKNLSWADGGLYSCEQVGVGGEVFYAQMVVIEYPQAIADEMVAGEDATITCRAGYSSARSDVLDAAHLPWLQGTVEGVVYPGRPSRQEAGPGARSDIGLQIDVTPEIGDDGKVFGCRLFTDNPPYSLESTVDLVVVEP